MVQGPRATVETPGSGWHCGPGVLVFRGWDGGPWLSRRRMAEVVLSLWGLASSAGSRSAAQRAAETVGRSGTKDGQGTRDGLLANRIADRIQEIGRAHV